jgi:hypothetical protein
MSLPAKNEISKKLVRITLEVAEGSERWMQHAQMELRSDDDEAIYSMAGDSIGMLVNGLANQEKSEWEPDRLIFQRAMSKSREGTMRFIGDCFRDWKGAPEQPAFIEYLYSEFKNGGG